MYNGPIINQMLKERNLKAADLLAYLGVRDNGTIARFTGANVKASRLEQIADFFEVSTDTFFIRKRDYSSGNSVVMGDQNRTRDINVGSSATSRAREAEAKVKSLEREIKSKEEIIKEKDERIKLLEQMVSLLTPPSHP